MPTGSCELDPMPQAFANPSTPFLRSRPFGGISPGQRIPSLAAIFFLFAAAVVLVGYWFGYCDAHLSVALLAIGFLLPFSTLLRLDNLTLHRTASVARHNEASADLILQSIGDAVIVTDPQLRVLRMNPVAESLTGLSLSDSLHRPITEIFNIVDETTRKPHENPAARVLRLNQATSVTARTLLVHKDGSELPIDDSASPIYADNGDLLGIVVVFRSIASRRQAENALIKFEKLAAVGRLAGTIVHEINNPLASVTNLLFLARVAKEHTELDSYLKLAEQELIRISTITHQTLSYYRQSNTAAPVHLDQILDSVLILYSPRLRHSRIVVDQRFRNLIPIDCFEGEIRQVLSNLIGNAIDAVRSASDSGLQLTAPQITIRVRQARHWSTDRKGLLITIADQGIGISPAALKQLGEPFFTTKGSEGTGLGVWVSREIIARHDGILSIRSSQSPAHHGSVFSLFLPSEATTR